MPDNSKVNVRRPDGTMISVTPDAADKLEVLGYKRETEGESNQRLNEQQRTEDYSGGMQGVAAFGEGIASGASLGLYDWAADKLGFDTAERAEYNPGKRLAGEIVGGVGGAIALGPEGALKDLGSLTPVGQLVRGADTLSEATGLGRIGTAAVKGAAEGAGFGAGGAISHDSLSGDGLSSEHILAGIGWGALFGAGLSAGGATLARGSERIAARVAAEGEGVEGAISRSTIERAIPQEEWSGLRSSVDALAKASTSIADNTSKLIQDATAAAGQETRGLGPGGMELLKLRGGGDDVLSAAVAEGKLATPEIQAVKKAYKAASRAVEEGEPEKIKEALNQYREAIGSANQAHNFGVEVPFATGPIEHLAGLAADHAGKAGADAFQKVADLRAIGEALSGFPRTSRGWLSLTGEQAENLHAGLGKALASQVPELSALSDSMGGAIQRINEVMGTQGANPVDALTSGWKTLREARTKAILSDMKQVMGRDATAASRQGTLARIFKMGASRQASRVAREMGGGIIGSSAAYQGTGALMDMLSGRPGKALFGAALGVKQVVQRRIRDAVVALQPVYSAVENHGGSAHFFDQAGKKHDSLSIKLDGTLDNEGGTPAQMAIRRTKEIADNARGARDALYKALQPMHLAGLPSLAEGLHKSAVSQFQALMDFIPKDPGTQISMGKSLWEPDKQAIARLRDGLTVFHDGVGSVERMLSNTTGAVTPALAEALRAFHPEIYQDIRSDVMTKASGWDINTDLHTQANIGLLLDIPMHSTQRPEWIAAQQMMYQQRNQPGKPKSSSGGGGSGAGNSMATPAQMVTINMGPASMTNKN